MPPTLRTNPAESTRERRFIRTEIRMSEDKRHIEGYAAKFNSWSQDLGGFREIIRPQAFNRCLAKQQDRDQQAYWNHDSRLILGREGNGTLELRADDIGLWFRATPPPTSYWLNDLKPLMENGYVNQCSFSFLPFGEKGDEWNADYSERQLFDVDFFEVSVVTEGAYLQTEASIRNHPRMNPDSNLWELNLAEKQLELLRLNGF